MSNSNFSLENMLSNLNSFISSNQDDEKDIEETVISSVNSDIENIQDNDDFMDGNEDDSDNEDDNNNESNSIMFTDSIRRDYIDQYYPDLKEVSNDELKIRTKIIRDENGIITDKLHKTLPFISKFEKTKIIGLRTSQLDNNSNPYVDTDITDSMIIAEMELKQKKLPFIICRPLPNGTREFWKLDDLDYIETI